MNQHPYFLKYSISLSKQNSEVFDTALCASPEGLNKEMFLVREKTVNEGR
jgi:hypothetical protein